MLSASCIRKIAKRGFSRSFPSLSAADLAYAVEQLDSGQSIDAVNRRLREWNEEARRVALAECRDMYRDD